MQRDWVTSGSISLTAMTVISARTASNGNVDVTVIAQRPKLAAFIPGMRSRLASAMQVDEDVVNVKATTEEKLGFTGEGLGIAAHAVALIEKA